MKANGMTMLYNTYMIQKNKLYSTYDTCTSYFLCSLFLYYRLIRVSLGKYVPKGEICHVYVVYGLYTEYSHIKYT